MVDAGATMSILTYTLYFNPDNNTEPNEYLMK